MRLTRNAKREDKGEGQKGERAAGGGMFPTSSNFSSLHFALYITKLHNFETSLLSLCSYELSCSSCFATQGTGAMRSEY